MVLSLNFNELANFNLLLTTVSKFDIVALNAVVCIELSGNYMFVPISKLGV